MSFWSRIMNKFSDDAAFMVRDGHELRWSQKSLPLNLYIDPDVSNAWAWEIDRAVEELNNAIGRRVMYAPLAPIDVMTKAFRQGPLRDSLTGTIYVDYVRISDGVPATDKDDPHKGGHADFRYDIRTGEIRNVLILVLWPQSEATFPLPRIVRHELGHALGLDHDPTRDSVMNAQAGAQGMTAKFTEKDLRTLKKAYGRG